MELDEPELVRIKGAEQPVPARRLLGVAEHEAIGRRDTTLVGRQWELAAVTGVLDRSIAGTGAVVGLAAPPGVGKSRLVAELAAVAASRGVPVYSTFCESHASEIPFHAVSRLLRGTFGVDELTDDAARPGVLVEALLLRGSAGDVEAAQEAIDRSEAVPMEDFQGMNVQHLRLRAMIAKARGDHNEYREIADRYRAFATSLGYSGHIAAAKAMT